MVISKQQQQQKIRKGKPNLKKAGTPVYPTTEMTTSVGDHRRNTMQFMPVEQRIMYDMLEELKAIHELLKKR